MNNCKEKLQNKNSEWYKYYTNDFQNHRKFQFFSIYYQAKEAILNPEVKTVLEFGTGRNITKALIEHFGIEHKSIDFDNKNFCPDEISTILAYKDNKKYDIVMAFQVLEHNPIETLEKHLLKMKELSNKYIYISLPFSGRWFSMSINFNLLPKFSFSTIFSYSWERLIFKKVRDIESFKKRENPYSTHWWEIGDKNFTKRDFEKLVKKIGLKIVKNFYNEFFPYHIFYLLKKNE